MGFHSNRTREEANGREDVKSDPGKEDAAPDMIQWRSECDGKVSNGRRAPLKYVSPGDVVGMTNPAQMSGPDGDIELK